MHSKIDRIKNEWLLKITDIPEKRYKWFTDNDVKDWCKNNIKKDFKEWEWRSYSYVKDMWFDYNNKYDWVVISHKHWTYVWYINFWYDKNEKHFIF